MTTPVLPDGGVLLHIGPHKTGTTAIQGSLAEQREALKAEGILYPGRAVLHNKPAAAAIQRPLGREGSIEPARHWQQLLSEVDAWDGRVVLSSEVFCEASPEAIEKVVRDLGVDRVKVVITLRPFERLLPSSWQQHVKSGYVISYAAWLENVLKARDDDPVGPTFWMRNNHPALIRRWGAVAGMENVTVVVVDDGDRGGIFRDFEAILRLPTGMLTPQASGVANRSLSVPEVELLRHLNARVRKDLSDTDYLDFIKRGAVQKVVHSRAPGPDEARLVVPGWAVRRARELAGSFATEIAAMDVQVVGDLALLAPTTPIDDREVPEPPTEVPMAVAVEFLASLLQSGMENRDRAAMQGAAHAVRDSSAKTLVDDLARRSARRLRAVPRRLRGGEAPAG